MESKRVEIPSSGVLDDLCSGREDECSGRGDDSRGRGDECSGQEDDSRGREDECSGREDDCRGRRDDCRGRRDDCRGRRDDCRGREDDCSSGLDIPPIGGDDCSSILDIPPRGGDDCSPPGRVQRAIKSTKRKRTSICPHCNIEIHSKNMKKHIYRRHGDTADGCSPSIQDNPPRRGDDSRPLLDNPPCRVQRAIKSTKITSICPHCNIEIHSKNMKKHIYRRHADTADPPEPEDYCRPIQDSPPRLEDDCSPIQDSPPRLEEDDCSPILDNPPCRVQRAIKSTTHSICPHCNIEIHSRNMKNHIYRKHAGTAVRDTHSDSHHRDASVPRPTASLRAVGPFAQPSGARARPTLVETKGPKRTTGEHPETNGLHRGLLGVLDEDEYFFLSLVPACKRMAPRKKAQLKLSIMQMVAQAEFEDTDDGLL